jgi:hypothetical protein
MEQSPLYTAIRFASQKFPEIYTTRWLIITVTLLITKKLELVPRPRVSE